MSYETALPVILRHEGGFVNHPLDKGGATNKGVTQAVYDTYRDQEELPRRSVKEIAAHEVEAIYRHSYWIPAKCDKMPPVIALPHFDAAVNHGIHGAAKILQRAAKVEADGVIGPKTLAAIHGNLDGLRDRMILERVAYYLAIIQSRPNQATFLLSWARRAMSFR